MRRGFISVIDRSNGWLTISDLVLVDYQLVVANGQISSSLIITNFLLAERGSELVGW